MRNLTVTILAALAASAAMATERPKPMPHGGNSAAAAAATASATSSSTSSAAGGSVGGIDLSLMNNPVSGDVSMRGGNTYSLVSGAAPLPPGLCPKGESVSVLWGFVAWSKTATERECLTEVLAYAREAIPKPQPAPITNYVVNHNYPAPAQAAASEPQKPVVVECIVTTPAPKPAAKNKDRKIVSGACTK